MSVSKYIDMTVHIELLLSAHPQLGQKLIDTCIRYNDYKKEMSRLSDACCTAKARREGIRICVERAAIKEATGIKTQLETFKDKMIKAEDEAKMLEQSYANIRNMCANLYMPLNLNLIDQTLSIKVDPYRPTYTYNVYAEIYYVLINLSNAQLKRNNINDYIAQIKTRQHDKDMEIKLKQFKKELISVENDISSKYVTCEVFVAQHELYQ